MMASTPLSRRRVALAAAAAALSAGSARGRIFAENHEAPPGLPDVPTTGGSRPGPIAVAPPDGPARLRGVAPAAIRIEKAGVDAPVETGDIADGEMRNPTGPWVVAWYDDLAAPAEGGNAVMAGHVDYWDTGPAVFWNLKDLVPGDPIQVIDEDGEAIEYAVEGSRLYNVATELTPEVIQEDVVGSTGQESLTLITCGGPFDHETGEYLERMVVRAVRV